MQNLYSNCSALPNYLFGVHWYCCVEFYWCDTLLFSAAYISGGTKHIVNAHVKCKICFSQKPHGKLYFRYFRFLRLCIFICMDCNLGEFEDEYHMIMEWSYYSHEHTEFLEGLSVFSNLLFIPDNDYFILGKVYHSMLICNKRNTLICRYLLQVRKRI